MGRADFVHYHFGTMAKPKELTAAWPMSIEQLEVGLRALEGGRADLHGFWDENVAPFRQTVLLAIRETSDALLSPTIRPCWRAELEVQLDELFQYLGLADRYIESRRLSQWAPWHASCRGRPN